MNSVELQLNSLPEEILLRVFGHCLKGLKGPPYNYKSFAQISEVCRKWHTLVIDQSLAAVPPLSTMKQNPTFFPLPSGKSVHQIEVSKSTIAICSDLREGSRNYFQISFIPFEQNHSPNPMPLKFGRQYDRVERIVWVADNLLGVKHAESFDIYDILQKDDKGNPKKIKSESLKIYDTSVIFSNFCSNHFAYAESTRNRIKMLENGNFIELPKPSGSVQQICAQKTHLAMLVKDLPKTKIEKARKCLNFSKVPHERVCLQVIDPGQRTSVDQSEDVKILQEKTNTYNTNANKKKEQAKKTRKEKRIEIALKKPAKEIASDGTWIAVSTDDKFLIYTPSKKKMSHEILYPSIDGKKSVLQNFVLKNHLLTAVLINEAQKRVLVTWNICNGTRLSEIPLTKSFRQMDTKWDVAAVVESKQIEFMRVSIGQRRISTGQLRVSTGQLIAKLSMENLSEATEEEFCSAKFEDKHLFIRTSKGGYVLDWSKFFKIQLNDYEFW